MAEGVEEDVMRADDDTMRVQHSAPQFSIPPLVWFVRARNESDGDGEVGRNGFLLLPCERDCRCEEPGDLCGWISDAYELAVTLACGEHCGNEAHTLRDSRSISCFIRRTAM
jgi:hypothetical protein